MAFSATDMRFFYRSTGFITVGGHLNAFLKCSIHGPSNLSLQLQKFTGIGAHYSGNRARFTQFRLPGLTRYLEQLAFLDVSSAEVISIKIAALETSRCFHIKNSTSFEEFYHLKENPENSDSSSGSQ
jgi:hypothetical protein